MCLYKRLGASLSSPVVKLTGETLAEEVMCKQSLFSLMHTGWEGLGDGAPGDQLPDASWTWCGRGTVTTGPTVALGSSAMIGAKCLAFVGMSG